MKIDIKKLAARWTLGRLQGAEIPEIATQALMEDYDGPALRELAGAVNPDLRDSAHIFEAALEELQAPTMTVKEAAYLLAREVSEKIINQKLTPYEGAKTIWSQFADEVRPDDHGLDPFVYWADEFEETTDFHRKEFCEAAILRAAIELVRTEAYNQEDAPGQ
jgi:hypothetical protein